MNFCKSELVTKGLMNVYVCVLYFSFSYQYITHLVIWALLLFVYIDEGSMQVGLPVTSS